MTLDSRGALADSRGALAVVCHDHFFLSNLGMLAGMLVGLLAATGRLSLVGGWREERNHGKSIGFNGFVWLWRVGWEDKARKHFYHL